MAVITWEQIPDIEICWGNTSNVDFAEFINRPLLAVLLGNCRPSNGCKRGYKYYVKVAKLAPDHVQWLDQELSGRCLLRREPKGHFTFWFDDKEDAQYFKANFT